jgi:hypothetical protein
MTFQWFSQDEFLFDEEPVETPSFDLDAAVNEANDDLQFITSVPAVSSSRASASGLSTLVSATTQTAAAFNEGFKEISRTVTDMQNAVFDLEDAVIVSTQAVVGAFGTARRIAGTWEFLKQRAADLALLFDNVQDALSLNQTEDYGVRLAERKNTRDQRKSARRMGASASRNQQTVVKTLNPELVRAFTARENQDLRDISRLHYGTPDSWRALLRYNNLSDSKLRAGQLVLVPRNPPQAEC